MTADPTGTPPDPQERQKEMLYRALRQSYWNLAAASSLLLGLLAVAALLLFSAGHWVEAQEQQILQGFKEELAGRSDVLASKAADLAGEVVPPVTEALEEQAAADLPEYVQALDREGDVLAANLEQSLQRKVNEHYAHSLTRYRDVFQEEFPEIDDPEVQKRLLDALEMAFRRQAEHYYVEEFREQTRRLNELWKHIPPLEQEPGDPKLRQLLVDRLMDWLRTKVGERVGPAVGVRGAEGPSDWLAGLPESGED